MTRFSLGREDDGECSVAFLPKRKRVAESEGDGSPEVERERIAFGVDEEEEEGAGSNLLSVSSSKEERGSLVVALTDPDGLDCPICFEPPPQGSRVSVRKRTRCVLYLQREDKKTFVLSVPYQLGTLGAGSLKEYCNLSGWKCQNADQGCKQLFHYRE